MNTVRREIHETNNATENDHSSHVYHIILLQTKHYETHKQQTWKLHQSQAPSIRRQPPFNTVGTFNVHPCRIDFSTVRFLHCTAH